jgi:hypothetical protein
LLLVFAAASTATAVYSALAGVYPITVIETVWSLVTLRRFVLRYRVEQLSVVESSPVA